MTNTDRGGALVGGVDIRLIALSFVLATTAPAQPPVNASGGELLPEQAAIDVEHYGLELSVDPKQHAIEGRLSMRARVLRDTRAMLLDLDDRLGVTAVEVAEDPVEFEHRDGRIRFSLPEVARAGDQV